MSDWNAEKYLLFKKQRTQPAIDLADRVRDCGARTVVDIGCGPGNSTAVLKSIFPQEYFDILSSCSAKFEIWETVYYHAMPSHRHLIEWVRGTRLRPYLDVLDEEEKISLRTPF